MVLCRMEAQKLQGATQTSEYVHFLFRRKHFLSSLPFNSMYLYLYYYF